VVLAEVGLFGVKTSDFDPDTIRGQVLRQAFGGAVVGLLSDVSKDDIKIHGAVTATSRRLLVSSVALTFEVKASHQAAAYTISQNLHKKANDASPSGLGAQFVAHAHAGGEQLSLQTYMSSMPTIHGSVGSGTTQGGSGTVSTSSIPNSTDSEAALGFTWKEITFAFAAFFGMLCCCCFMALIICFISVVVRSVIWPGAKLDGLGGGQMLYRASPIRQNRHAPGAVTQEQIDQHIRNAYETDMASPSVVRVNMNALSEGDNRHDFAMDTTPTNPSVQRYVQQAGTGVREVEPESPTRVPSNLPLWHSQPSTGGERRDFTAVHAEETRAQAGASSRDRSPEAQAAPVRLSSGIFVDLPLAGGLASSII